MLWIRETGLATLNEDWSHLACNFKYLLVNVIKMLKRCWVPSVMYMCVSHRCRRCGSRGSAGLETSTFSFSAPQAVSALQLTRAGSRRCVSRSSWSQACPEACCRLPLPCAGPWQSVELPDRLRQSPLGTARGCTCISLSEYRLSLIRRAALAWPQHAMWKYPESQSIDSSLSCRASSKIHGCKGERESNFSWGNIHDLDMPQPWFCTSPVVLIHVGSDPSWDQTGQRLLRDFWLENRSRAQNRRKRMKGFRIRLRMITFVLAVAIPHAHAALGSCFLAAPHKVLMEQHPGCAWSTHSAHKSQPGSGASPRVCYWPHRAVYRVFYLILLWADWEPDDKNVPCMI